MSTSSRCSRVATRMTSVTNRMARAYQSSGAAPGIEPPGASSCSGSSLARWFATMTTRKLFHDAAERAADYLETLAERSVAPLAEHVARLQELAAPLQEEPLEASEVLRRLDAIASPATLGTAGPRFFGWVIGGALPASVAANVLAAAWDQNAGGFATSPASAALEDASLGWLASL